MHTLDETANPSTPDTDFARRLVHRWFIQYNPLYILSAVLVLVGLTLLSRACAYAPANAMQLVVPGVTELYAFALVGSAALLTRLGLRRPAVFVALLAVVYQGDVALSTETDALLGGFGFGASLGWWMFFVVKLRALAWAMRVRLSRSAWIVPALGAAGVALVPQLARRLDGHALATGVGVWIFLLLAAAAWTARVVTSTSPLDAWGRTIMRRAVRATWWIWAGLLLAHILFWIDRFGITATVLVPVAPLMATRWIRQETKVMAIVTATLVVVAAFFPEALSAAATMSAIALGLHALRRPAPPAPHEGPTMLYRGASLDEGDTPRVALFEPTPARSRTRCFAAAALALHLALWTAAWSGGAFPAHVVALDVAVSIVVLAIVLRSRVVAPLFPLGALHLHAAAAHGLVRTPRSIVEWGITCVSAGFALLAASLLASARARHGLRRT
jgi:hypothetical protein